MANYGQKLLRVASNSSLALVDSNESKGNVRGILTGITISGVKKEVSNLIQAYFAKNTDGTYMIPDHRRIPPYIEGMPGLGKTEIVRQIAEENNLGFVSYSITHLTKNMVVGLPVIESLDNGEKYTNYTISEIIASVMREEEKGKKEGILFLDEFSCMPETIMSNMLAFLQTRNIGQYTLPSGWIIVLAGNPPQYNRYSKAFDPTILDRFRKIDLTFSATDFLKYATEKKLNKKVVEYLTDHKDSIYVYKKEEGEVSLVTPRGWENLAKSLDVYEQMNLDVTLSTIRQFIKCEEVALAFYGYYSDAGSMDSVTADNIINGFNLKNMVKKYSEKNFHERWKVAEYLISYFTQNYCYESCEALAEKISNLFEFLGGIDEDSSLCEMFYNAINNVPRFMKTVMKYEIKGYIAMGKRLYGSIG